MRAGRLDTRVNILTRTVTRDAMNGETVSWSTSANSFWAQKIEQRPIEAWKAGQTAAQLELALRCRWSTVTAAISVKGRLRIGGTDYEVIGISEPRRREELNIICVSLPL